MNKGFTRPSRPTSSIQAGLALLLAAGAGCLGSDQVLIDGQNRALAHYSDAVCNPFGGSSAGPEFGLIGSLRYLRDEQPRYSSVRDYINFAELVPRSNIFLADLNVPTRPFDRGFMTTDGRTLRNQAGNTLYEYFSMSYESVLTLPTGAVPGDYQFAVLSDDGSVLSIDEGSGMQVLVDNDGTHPTKMGCATRAVDMTTPRRIKLDYYQGPRFHIAMMLLMRPWPTGAGAHPVNDPQCGLSGNSRFFDSTQDPPTPRPAFNDLIARGWQVVPASFYRLPPEVAQNPCLPDGITTTITRVTPGETPTNRDEITFEFTSNHPQATFSCILDSAAAVPCVSPVTATNLSEGNHHFHVVARAPDNRVDPIGATWDWTTDFTGPQLLEVIVTTTLTTITTYWRTNEPTIGYINWGVGLDTSNRLDDTNGPSTEHSLTLNNLTPHTIHSIQVNGHDLALNPLPPALVRIRTEDP